MMKVPAPLCCDRKRIVIDWHDIDEEDIDEALHNWEQCRHCEKLLDILPELQPTYAIKDIMDILTENGLKRNRSTGSYTDTFSFTLDSSVWYDDSYDILFSVYVNNQMYNDTRNRTERVLFPDDNRNPVNMTPYLLILPVYEDERSNAPLIGYESSEIRDVDIIDGKYADEVLHPLEVEFLEDPRNFMRVCSYFHLDYRPVMREFIVKYIKHIKQTEKEFRRYKINKASEEYETSDEQR